MEKVKQARVAREHERSMRERERDNEIREMDSARFQQWSKQEETFHLEQARLRSKIRIKVKLRMAFAKIIFILILRMAALNQLIFLPVTSMSFKERMLQILISTNHIFT